MEKVSFKPGMKEQCMVKVVTIKKIKQLISTVLSVTKIINILITWSSPTIFKFLFNVSESKERKKFDPHLVRISLSDGTKWLAAMQSSACVALDNPMFNVT